MTRQNTGGYAKFRDVDGNGQIDSKDKVYLGNFYPTWNGGFTNSFSFRGLTFLFVLTIHWDIKFIIMPLVLWIIIRREMET